MPIHNMGTAELTALCRRKHSVVECMQPIVTGHGLDGIANKATIPEAVAEGMGSMGILGVRDAPLGV